MTDKLPLIERAAPYMESRLDEIGDAQLREEIRDAIAPIEWDHCPYSERRVRLWLLDDTRRPDPHNDAALIEAWDNLQQIKELQNEIDRLRALPAADYGQDRERRAEIAELEGQIRALEPKPVASRGIPPVGGSGQGQDRGVSKNEILAVNWPLVGRFSQDSLARALANRRAWIEPARVGPPGRAGSKGGNSHRWNPAILAHILIEHRWIFQSQHLDKIIADCFPEYLDKWDALKEFPPD